MKFQVPQFIEIEDKLFGPLTLKQFIYLAGGGGLSAIIYLSFDSFVLFLVLAAPVVVLSLALAFVEINRRPFIFVMESAIKYIFRKKLYIWQRSDSQTGTSYSIEANPKENSLNDLNWSLSLESSEAVDDQGDDRPSSHRIQPQETTEENLNNDSPGQKS